MICDDRACQFRSRSLPVGGVGGVSCPLCHHGRMLEEVILCVCVCVCVCVIVVYIMRFLLISYLSVSCDVLI